MVRWRTAPLILLLAAGRSALAGPPYVTDDPEPTDLGHYEIYLFTSGSTIQGGWNGMGGVDYNYGAAKDLQLTAVLPIAWDTPGSGPAVTALGNMELAAKYKFVHQENSGIDVALFPRVFLPAGSARVGERHASLLLPFWVQRSSEQWATFGGGGCEFHHGGDSQNFCLLGWAVTTQVSKLQIGLELYHQTAAVKGGTASSGLGIGATYYLTEHLHLMGSAGPGLQNAQENGRAFWFVALLVTF
jgi:hypothetical protein